MEDLPQIFHKGRYPVPDQVNKGGKCRFWLRHQPPEKLEKAEQGDLGGVVSEMPHLWISSQRGTSTRKQTGTGERLSFVSSVPEGPSRALGPDHSQ